MSKLLRANFSRLFKDKIFWLISAAIVVITLITAINSVQSFNASVQRGLMVKPDDYIFSQASVLGIFFAVFISLFLGTEYSDGTIRNKLSVGHTHDQVYLSNFIACFSADLIIVALWLLCTSPSLFLIGALEMGVKGYLTYLAVAVCFTASLTAIFVLIGTFVTNKAFSVIGAALVWFVLMVIAGGLNDRLEVPEMNGGMAYVDGEFVMIEATPNPLYISGTARLVCECVLDFLPTGQALLMSDTEIDNPVRMIVSSVLITFTITACGIGFFRRKDLK